MSLHMMPGLTVVPGPGVGAPVGPAQPAPGGLMDKNAVVVVDGTPVRVVILALSAAAALTALKWSGFRFNVGVSS